MAMDDFFRVAPSVSAGLRQGFSDIQSILKSRDEIDQMYRNQDLRRMEQARDLGAEFPGTKIETTAPTTYVGLRAPTSPVAYANVPRVDLGTYEAPVAAPASTTPTTPTTSTTTDGAAALAAPWEVVGTPTKTPTAGVSVRPRGQPTAQPTTRFPRLDTGPSNRLVDRMRAGTTADPTAPISAADIALLEKAVPPTAKITDPKIAQAAQQYDTVRTNYDSTIAQAAQANGIDPVIFKRLIGTESSFRPDAVSPRGERYGLGIAQINQVHGLSRADMLDPNKAIPFAAQLFKQYLDEAGGDYAEAIYRYKGASTDKGRQDMGPAVATVLAGTGQVVVDNTGKTRQGEPAITPPPPPPVPETNFSAPLPAVQGADKQTTEIAKGVDDQLRRALSMAPREHDVEVSQLLRSREMLDNQTRETQAIAARQYQFAVQNAQRTQAQRNGLLERARMAQRVGNIREMNDLLKEVATIDTQVATNIQGAETTYRTATMEVDAVTKANYDKIDNELYATLGRKGVSMFSLTGDTRNIEAVWSHYTGQEIRLQPRTDGKYNIWVNQGGELKPVIDKQTNTAIGFDKSYIANEFMKTVDAGYRVKDAEARQAAQQAQAKLAGEIKLKLVEGMNALQKVDAEKRGDAMIEELKRNGKVYEVKQNPENGEITGFSFENGAPIVIKIRPEDAYTPDGRFRPEAIQVSPLIPGLRK